MKGPIHDIAYAHSHDNAGIARDVRPLHPSTPLRDHG